MDESVSQPSRYECQRCQLLDLLSTSHTLQGLDDDLDLKRILKAIKKRYNCNGNIKKDKEYGDIMQVREFAGLGRRALIIFLRGAFSHFDGSSCRYKATSGLKSRSFC
jgi:translation initiation factor SUI1